MKNPSLSIIIATYNSQRTLDQCLGSIRNQYYPQNKIEIILVDGGSTDQTLVIGEKYGCKIVLKPKVPAEAAKAYGLSVAQGELIADFSSDNILPEKHWLQKIVYPLVKHKNIIASYPLRYHYRKNDTIFNRYVALFGVNDPLPFYLGKADRQSYLYPQGYQLAGDIVSKNFLHVPKIFKKTRWYTVKFTPRNLPTVGANGFVIRKQILQLAKVAPADYFHIDVIYDLVKQGYDTFAVVDTTIVHDTADTLWSLLKKRKRYFREFYLQQINRRRYHIVARKDYPKLALFIFYSLTFVQPLWIAWRGYFKKYDVAWFIHPLFCFLITLIYTKEVVRYWLGNYRYYTPSKRSRPIM